MNYYELTCTTLLLKDIYFDSVGEELGKNISNSMLLDSELANIHESKGYKYYVYDSLYPRERDKTYKKGNVYIFRIRSIDKELILKFRKTLSNYSSKDGIQILSTEIKTYRQFYITELYTVTPAVATVDDRFWVRGDSIELLDRRINENLIKKYQDYYGEDINTKESFIQAIELKNYKPIGFVYKDIRLIGNKFNILVKSDEVSQKLAFLALGTGLLEKNSSNGMGFCIAR